MKNYKKLNDISGWIAFAIAAFVYLSTIEPTVSFWDCGEYIATSFKLQVGHPPGAPFFQMIGRLFTMAVPLENVAAMINLLSGLCSAFTILFLFWSITALARKCVVKSDEITKDSGYAILGSGMVGALAYTFSDSFWFSAVEGEVYSMASLFVALVFWAILKWERETETKNANRWIVLIAYLIGLSIGVHLLSLLAIPAIVFVYYFKRYKPTKKSFAIAFILSFVILLSVQNIIIPGVVNMIGKFELFFVNSLGLPFNSGALFFGVLLIGLILWGLNYTYINNKPFLNTALLCFTALLIGYSTFFMLVIRSNANTPMDENNPENAINMLAYLNREQYGSWPLLYGQYFNAPLDPREPYKDGNPVYVKDETTVSKIENNNKDRYIIAEDRKGSTPSYDPDYCTVFPRMWSDNGNHVARYKMWANIKGPADKKPSFGENILYFLRYQVNWMYFRYFMWNFAGRQNDIQGHGDIANGNWLSGIPFIDEMRLGPQGNLPESMTSSKAMNKFYFLPLLLGLFGLAYHAKNDKQSAFVVLLFFFATGLAIIIFLNQKPEEPRERDYAYAASFYAFAIWIGFGVLSLWEYAKQKVESKMAAILVTVVCILLVPGIMAKEGWDDHDRSGRYTARDFAANYLNSCAPNAILFTNGDNDTFPLWYAQEVEGIRRDVRVMNLSLSNTDWYIDQMRRKAYESEPIPFSMTPDKYRQGTRDYVPFYDRKIPGYTSVKDLMDFIASDNLQTKIQTSGGKNLDYFPTKKLFIPVNVSEIVEKGIVAPELSDQVVDRVEWEIQGNYILKNSLMVLDMLANFNWDRPVYFAITVGSSAYMKLEDYFQLEGLAYRLVPIKTISRDGQTGRVATDLMYDNMMNKFKWGGMDKGNVYMDETNMRMTYNLRNNFARLANELMDAGKVDSAIAVLDKCIEVMPDKVVPYNFFMLPVAESYYASGVPEKANKIVERLADIYEDDLDYYFSLNGDNLKPVEVDMQRAMSVMQRLVAITTANKQTELAEKLNKSFEKLKIEYSRVSSPQ